MALYGAFSRGKSAILLRSGSTALDCNTVACQTLRSLNLAASRGVLGAKSAVRLREHKGRQTNVLQSGTAGQEHGKMALLPLEKAP